MDALFILCIALGGFGLLILAVYIPLCYWLWLDYRHRLRGRKGFIKYFFENC